MKDVTDMLEMTVYTVRHYTDCGLVPNVQRDENGNRIFDETALNWLKAAQFLRNCGLSVSEVKEYFDLCQQGSSTLQQRAEIIHGAKQIVNEKLATYQQQLEVLDERFNHYQSIIKGETRDDSNPMNWNPQKLC